MLAALRRRGGPHLLSTSAVLAGGAVLALVTLSASAGGAIGYTLRGATGMCDDGHESAGWFFSG